MARITLRIPDQLERQVVIAASQLGMKRTEYIEKVLAAVRDPNLQDGDVDGLKAKLRRAGIRSD